MSKVERLHRRQLLGLAGLLAPGVLLTLADRPMLASGESARQPSPMTKETTALLAGSINAPLRVPASDGLEHLEYDLILTNVCAAPITLTTIEIVAPDGRLLRRLEGDELAALTQPVFFAGGPPVTEVPVAGTLATVIDLAVPPDTVPARITHHITYTLPADTPYRTIIGSLEIAGPDLAVDPRPPLVVVPPMRGSGWFNANAISATAIVSAASNHRNFRLAVDGSHLVTPETFAIDWLLLRDGLPAEGDGSRNEQYFGFGAEVVAAAGGTVAAVRNDMPNETPGQPTVAVHHPEDYAGNHVTVEIASGVYALYAHLQPGSVSVRAGERVETGQPLGRLGNTGNTSGPHLHFQLSDSADALTSNSLPFVLDRYTLAGTVDPMALAAAAADPTGTLALPVEPLSQVQTDTFPLMLTLIDLP
ncbi:MAG: M23 family metallopeptidase [Dehalococcoidia bacterium]